MTQVAGTDVENPPLTRPEKRYQRSGDDLFLCPELNNKPPKPKSHKRKNTSNLYPEQRTSIPICKELLQINKKKIFKRKKRADIMNKKRHKKGHLGI